MTSLDLVTGQYWEPTQPEKQRKHAKASTLERLGVWGVRAALRLVPRGMSTASITLGNAEAQTKSATTDLKPACNGLSAFRLSYVFYGVHIKI